MTGPPRPKAITTFMASQQDLPGVLTLLYSLRTNVLQANKEEFHRSYPPEVVVVIAKNQGQPILADLKSLLCPHLCTRILAVDHWPPPATVESQSAAVGASLLLTKQRIFGLQQYSRILHLDSDCLVVRDVASLLDLPGIDAALVAAAPGQDCAAKFSSSVMVIHPSTETLDHMHKAHLRMLAKSVWTDSDAFLNHFFSAWATSSPSTAHLDPRYNAHVSLNGTDRWNSEACILHYDTESKPWEAPATNVEDNPLRSLYHEWLVKSQKFMDDIHERKSRRRMVKAKRPPSAKGLSSAAATNATSSNPNDPATIHRLIHRRFKMLRKQGLSMEEAMTQAREELQPQRKEMDAGSQVAAMFGML